VVLSLEGALKKFTLEELKQYNGRDGRPAYFAYKGKVYDATESFLWTDGDHQGQHEAGRDITNEMASAPHGEEMLERVKLAGVLIVGPGK
jgi:predicted heme/steroid binding protein